MSKRKFKLMEAQRKLYEQDKKNNVAVFKANSVARRKIEALLDQKSIGAFSRLSQLDISKEEENKFEEYLLKSNLGKNEKSRRISGRELQSILLSWTLEELNILWEMRKDKLSSQYAAAALLAYIRFKMGIDPSRKAPKELLCHDSIMELKDILPRGVLPIVEGASATDEVYESNRQILAVRRTVRHGQAIFRENLLNYYGGVCLISGATTLEVIEAAHIAPYNGTITNSLNNGLLLRVDLHRLFDCGLLGIQPDTHTIRIAPEARDYEELDGLQLSGRKPIAASRSLLQHRWKQFLSNVS